MRVKPADFLQQPMGSVLEKSEAETIARNCMVILKRTGNEWRMLTEEEYLVERTKDGAGASEASNELRWFRRVVGYTTSAKAAGSFSPTWAKVLPTQAQLEADMRAAFNDPTQCHDCAPFTCARHQA